MLVWEAANAMGDCLGDVQMSKDHFNLNFDITALLTNKHIGISALARTNQSFHLLYLQQRSIKLQKHQDDWVEKQHVQQV